LLNYTSQGCEVPYVHATSSPPGKLPRAPFQGRQELDLPVLYTPMRSNPGETPLWQPGHVRKLHSETIPPKLYPQNYTAVKHLGPRTCHPSHAQGISPKPFRSCKNPLTPTLYDHLAILALGRLTPPQGHLQAAVPGGGSPSP
jgi:hypothetical protein